jgi:hypothetical protein
LEIWVVLAYKVVKSCPTHDSHPTKQKLSSVLLLLFPFFSDFPHFIEI